MTDLKFFTVLHFILSARESKLKPIYIYIPYKYVKHNVSMYISNVCVFIIS